MSPPAHISLLTELRRRIIYSLLVFFILFALFTYFSNTLYDALANPLLQFLPQRHLIATQLISPVFVPFKLALMAAMLLAIPFFLYQLWAYIAPALYRNEQRLLWPFFLLSIALFYTGIVFAYFVIFPILFRFLTRLAPQSVVLTPDISEYLNFTIQLLLLFGGLFEIPILMALLVLSRVATPAQLARMRSYALVAAFILGMLLAPPDVLSQTILALPIYLLYEAGLLLVRFIYRR